jgi:hypothetical protein
MDLNRLAETSAASAQSNRRMVPRSSARRVGLSVENPHRQAAGPLPILRATNELPVAGAVLSGRSPSLAQVAEPSNARKEPHLGRLCAAIGAPSVAPTEDHSCLDDQFGESALKNPLREICTVGSVRGGSVQLPPTRRLFFAADICTKQTLPNAAWAGTLS